MSEQGGTFEGDFDPILEEPTVDGEALDEEVTFDPTAGDDLLAEFEADKARPPGGQTESGGKPNFKHGRIRH